MVATANASLRDGQTEIARLNRLWPKLFRKHPSDGKGIDGGSSFGDPVDMLQRAAHATNKLICHG